MVSADTSVQSTFCSPNTSNASLTLTLSEDRSTLYRKLIASVLAQMIKPAWITIKNTMPKKWAVSCDALFCRLRPIVPESPPIPKNRGRMPPAFSRGWEWCRESCCVTVQQCGTQTDLGWGPQWNRVLIAPFCVLKFIFMPRGSSGTLRPRLAPVQSWMGSAKSI